MDGGAPKHDLNRAAVLSVEFLHNLVLQERDPAQHEDDHLSRVGGSPVADKH